MKVKVMINGEEYEVEVEEVSGGKFRVKFGGKSYEVEAEGLGIDLSTITEVSQRGTTSTPVAPPTGPNLPRTETAPAPKPEPEPGRATAAAQSSNVVVAPMPGKVLRVLVRVGDVVSVGQGLLVLEAMKMENEIPAPKNGRITKIHVKENQTVNTGDPLIEIE